MKQNQKGITIIGLLITVIIIVTIAGVCIYTGRDILEEAKLEQLKTNMLLIQAKCHSIQDKVTAGEEADYIGTALELTTVYEKFNIPEENKNEEDKWYGLKEKELEEKEYNLLDESGNSVLDEEENPIINQGIGLGDILKTEEGKTYNEVTDYEYIVNYYNGEVIYTKGHDGKYTLTDIKGTDRE